MMIRKIMLLGVLGAFLVMATGSFAAEVYRTANGTKYHQETCRLIKNKKPVAIDLKEAIEEGLTPCKVCLKEEASAVENKKK